MGTQLQSVGTVTVSSTNAKHRTVLVTDGGTVCRVLAVIRETRAAETVTVCTTSLRQREVYRGYGQPIEVRVVAKPDQSKDGQYFLLHYESKGKPEYKM